MGVNFWEMSQYILIAGAVCEIIGTILVSAATGVTYIRGSQASDTNEKTSLHVSGAFLGVSLIIAIICLISGFILLGTKGCGHKFNKIIFIISFIIFLILYIVALVILYVFKTRLQNAGNTEEASALNSAFILPIVGLGFYILGFILFYAVLGSKLRKLAKVCKIEKKITKRVKTVEKKAQQVETKAQQVENKV